MGLPPPCSVLREDTRQQVDFPLPCSVLGVFKGHTGGTWLQTRWCVGFMPPQLVPGMFGGQHVRCTLPPSGWHHGKKAPPQSAAERPHPCIWRVNEQKTGAACGMHTAPIMLAPQKETPLHYWGVKDRGMWGQHVGCMPPPLCQPATPTPTSSPALLMPFPIPLTPTGQFQRLGPDIPQGGERQLF